MHRIGCMNNSLHFKEGEEVILPCSHCTSISLKVNVLAGTSSLKCPKCELTTQIKFDQTSSGWSVRVDRTGEGTTR